MISVSSDYKNYISNNLSVSAKNKIIVDGVEYLGNVLKTYPKISHSTSKICGSFPAKTVSFEIYDLNNSLDFENKEIEVYKGLMLNGTPYYVKQGVFIPQKDNITTNISDRSIKFDKVQDKTQFLDDKYESELDWSNGQTHTGLEIVQEICTKKGLTLKSNSFAWASYNFNQPNFPSNITYRQVLARLGEIGGETVIFDYNGELEFKSQYTTGDTIGRSRYGKISKEKSITFNSVVLGKQGINDDIIYPANMLDSDRVSFRIEDNPFVDLYREEMIEDVADFIIGLTYVPFACDNLLDGFIYELNDVISITDRNNETSRAVILSIDNSSRIASNIKLDTTIEDSTDYNLAGSSKQELANVRLDVDHINNQISSLVTKTEHLEESIEVLNPTVDTALILVSTNNSRKPFSPKTIVVNHSCKYLGEPITLTPTTSNSFTGIACTITNSTISFAVNSQTALQNEDNKFTFTWSYIDLEGNVFTATRSITVSALMSETEQNVIISDNAPSDTSVLWYDTNANLIYRYDEDKSDWVKINDYDEQIGDINTMITGTNGLTQQLTDLTGRVNANEENISNKVDSSTYNQLQTQVNTLQTNTYLKTEIQQIVSGEGVDGVTVTAVKSTSATFDKDGMHYQKSTEDTTTTINYAGLEVDDKNNNELLFAGVRGGSSESVVETQNLKVSTYLVSCDNTGRMEKFQDVSGVVSGTHYGPALFVIGGN